MSLQHIQKNSPRLLPKPAKFEKNPPNGYRVIRKTKCGDGGAGGAAGAGGAESSPIHKQASLAGRLITLWQAFISIYISCKSDEASFNILVTENIKDFRRNFKTPKFKSVAMATVATGYPQNIVSSRSSWVKHILKIW